MASRETVLAAAKRLVTFINASPSPYHVVNQCKQSLKTAGFVEISEKESWSIKPNGKYFVTRNQSTLVAFSVGGQFKPGNGFSIVGSHTDSPCPRLKPITRKTKEGYLCVGVEYYGGGIWSTWFDRDLTVAGRVVVREASGDSMKLHSKLIHIEKPIMRIPHMAIHLQREMNEKFNPNRETEMVPVLAMSITEKLNSQATANCAAKPKDAQYENQAQKHHPLLIKLLSDKLGCQAEDILDFELYVCDTQPGVIGGALDEFIFCPRLDNQVNCFTSLEALVNANGLEKDPNVRVITLYDNEEVGSQSAQGAGSSLTEQILRRLSASTENPVAFEESISRSLLVSADQVHACHPNYAHKHEEDLRPSLHDGPIIKFNGNQRYATTAISAAVLREAGRRCGVRVGDVAVRNDSSCGSTIGPILAAKLGMRTVDTGTPQLSMHSVREMAGVEAIHQVTCLYQSFFENFADIDSAIIED
ncbi:aspartyl aminopeptidase-like [Sycon ciliatum]|uniref:aspartyl aminopeptidase-like n=1 Tax=Sycon ciliatum TaxID=27933 RepID=UPI0031F6FC16